MTLVSRMDEREIKVVEAAIRVISRYGVKRTTMNDIADEAGLVRQTIYTIFPNKKEVLRATSRYICKNALDAVAAGWPRAESLDAKLTLLFEQMTVRPYVEIHASPHAEDIMEGITDAAKEVLDEAYAHYRRIFAEALQPYSEVLAAKGLSAEGLAEFVQRTAKGIKADARDADHLRALLADLKTLVLIAAGEQRPKKAPPKKAEPQLSLFHEE